MAIALVSSALLVAGPAAIGGLSASGHSAERSLSQEWQAPGGEITVSITVRDYGPFAQVVETLPEGFSLLGASLSATAVQATDNKVKFTLLGDEQFSYTAVAPDKEGLYEFSGVLLDSFKNEKMIGGSVTVRVGNPPTPIPEPTSTPTATPAPTSTPRPTSIPEERLPPRSRHPHLNLRPPPRRSQLLRRNQPPLRCPCQLRQPHRNRHRRLSRQRPLCLRQLRAPHLFLRLLPLRSPPYCLWPSQRTRKHHPVRTMAESQDRSG